MLLPFKTAAIWSSGPAASTFKDIPVSIVVPTATLLIKEGNECWSYCYT